MTRGTTPTHTFKVPVSTEIIKTVKVIYAQDEKQVLIKETDDFKKEGNSLTVKLTQEETLAFDHTKRVKIQMRILTVGGDALASRPLYRYVGELLDDEVLT